MKLIGVDVYIWSQTIPELPKKIGLFTLEMISNSGTKLYPPPTPEIDVTDWFQCRYIAFLEITHCNIDELLSFLSSDFTWTKAQKLYEHNGANAFSQPY